MEPSIFSVMLNGDKSNLSSYVSPSLVLSGESEASISVADSNLVGEEGAEVTSSRGRKWKRLARVKPRGYYDEAFIKGLGKRVSVVDSMESPAKKRGKGVVSFDQSAIKSFSKGHVDSIVRDCEGSRWCFTGFYGEPNLALRFHSWSLLHKLEGLFSLPWIIGGDFNEIFKEEEKIGGCSRSFKAIADFRDAVDGCRLLDLGFKGCRFT
ncbi:hypothetical protein ACOSQ4_006991 [Xanthoceras sorbifolium]